MKQAGASCVGLLCIQGQEDRMTVTRISTGSPFEEKIGYSRAVVADG